MGVSKNGGTPRNGKMIALQGKIPDKKWMMTRGTPISGNLHRTCELTKKGTAMVTYGGWARLICESAMVKTSHD